MLLGSRLFWIVPMLVLLALAGGCSKRLSPVERWIIKGDQFYAEGDFAAADDCYKHAVGIERDNPQALSRLGRVAFRQGRTLSAYFLLKGTVEKIPEETDLVLVYGLASHALGRTADARAIAKRVIERDPANAEALVLLVETGIGSRDAHEARQIIDQAQQKAGTDAAIFHVARGMLELSRGDYEPAEKEIRRALELDPQSAAAHSQLANLHLARRDRIGVATELKAAAGLSPLRSPRRIKYISFLITEGRVAEAQQELDAITNKAPDYIPAWSVLMKLAFDQGRLEDSLTATEKVISADRANYDAWMLRIAIKLRRSQLDEVIDDLKQVESFYNRSPEVKYKLALAYLEKDNLTACKSNLQQALRLAPNNEDALVLQAQVDLRQGDFDAAISAMTRLAQREPGSSRALLTLAQAQRASGALGAALETYRVLAKTFPRVPDSFYFIAVAQLEMGERKESREAFEQALQVSDQYWPALEMLTELDLVEKRDALGRIEIAVAKYPEAAPPLLLRAKTRLILDDLTGAEADLSRGLTLAPNTPYPYLMLARIYNASGRVREGREKLTALAERNPTATVLVQLGVLQASAGLSDKARESYEKALALDPTFVPALNNLAMLLVELGGDLEQASELAKRARAIAPEDPYVADTTAWILVRHGQYHAALRTLQPVVERLPAEPELQYHLGMIYYYLGQEDLARTTLRNMLATAQDSGVKQSAEIRLAVLDIDATNPPADSRAALEERLRRDPDDFPALIRLGAMEGVAGRHAESAKYFEAALKVNPKTLPVLTALVDLYTGPFPNPERAKELARAARDLSPNDARLAWKLGRLLLESGGYLAANGMLLDAARAFPNDREVQYDLARSQYSLGRLAEAEQALARAVSPSGDSAVNPDARSFARLLAAVRRMNPSDADIADAEQVLKTTPDSIPALMVKAASAERRNAHTAARDIYDKILVINPQFVPAMRQLASLYGDQFGDDKKSEEWSLNVLKVFPEDPEAGYQLGVVQFRRGEYDLAARTLGLSVRRRPDHALAQFYLGMTYAQLKNSAEARSALESALKLRLPPQESAQALRTLDELGFRPPA